MSDIDKNRANPENVHVSYQLLKQEITAERLLYGYSSILEPRHEGGGRIAAKCPYEKHGKPDKNATNFKIYLNKNDCYCYACQGFGIPEAAFDCAKKVHGSHLPFDRLCYHVAVDLGIDLNLVTENGSGEYKKVEAAPDDALYKEIFGKNYFAFNSHFKNIKTAFGDVFVPVEQEKVYFHSLFRSNREKHDEIVLCYAQARFEQIAYEKNEEEAKELLGKWVAILKKIVKDVGNIEKEWYDKYKKVLVMKKIMGG